MFGKICKAVTRISEIALNSITGGCLSDNFTICSSNPLVFQSEVSLGYYK